MYIMGPVANLCCKNNVVVEPFMGSGTTIVEAKLHGSHSHTLDRNSMALKIA